MGSNESRIAFFAAILAFLGAVAGTILTGHIQKYQWEREVRYDKRQKILAKRLDLIEKTSIVLNNSTYAEVLNKEIEYWYAIAELGKEAARLNLARIIDDLEPIQLNEPRDILNRYRQAQERLAILNSEYASTMQLNALYFGIKTREAIEQITAQENWWETSKDSKMALMVAMFEELHL